ncbi:uncharacterized protein BX664DRAFT_336654 [Halteromyces radiatus]|uniref:uncharacterized protein n=1 Tax=Halteromyces radiatus TaxID=101107 RepID=UPI00221EDE07|nr:uncharacterized protein BX664DRAFT_336654 [Halteromyces radiatus]KAI8086744.1 hypothetical protein BX664DRAFT_336654 [Halteromyces radiatus]
MGDQGSSYSVLQDIPVMVSPHYRLPKQIVIDKELVPISEEALKLTNYSFSVERQAISNVVAMREKQQQAEKELADRLEAYQAEKLQQRKAAARKIAPGFLDTETRILHPQPFHSNKTLLSEDLDHEINKTNQDDPPSTHSSPQQQHQTRQQQLQHSPYQRYRSSSNPADFIHPSYSSLQQQEKRTSAQSHIDYLKFEQGLAPPDPWDTPENDFVALRSILGNQDGKGNQDQQHYTPPPNPSAMPTPQYSSPYLRHAPSTNMYPEGPWIRPPQYPTPGHHAPALPPKLLKEELHPNGNSPNASPQIPPPPPPPPPSSSSPSSSHHGSPTLPPPLPPLPNGTQESLIQELANMGFSHSQAADALQKNENDLTRATNFLLDNT